MHILRCKWYIHGLCIYEYFKETDEINVFKKEYASTFSKFEFLKRIEFKSKENVKKSHLTTLLDPQLFTEQIIRVNGVEQHLTRKTWIDLSTWMDFPLLEA